MAIAKVADRGTHAALDAATTSTLTITNPTSIALGNHLIMRIAGDNSGSSGAARTLTIPNSASGDPRNAWTIHAASNIDPGAASAGCTTWIAYCHVDTPYQAGDTIILNWSGNIGANAEVLEEWSGIERTTPVVSTPTNRTQAASTTLATPISGTPTASGQMFYCAIGWEGIAGDTYTEDTDTTNGSWTTLTTVASANATRTNNVRIAGAYKVVNGTSAQSWTPTGITASTDMAAAAYIFAPYVPVSRTMDGKVPVASDLHLVNAP